MAFVYIIYNRWSIYNRLLSYILVHIIDGFRIYQYILVAYNSAYNKWLSYILVHIIDGFRIY